MHLCVSMTTHLYSEPLRHPPPPHLNMLLKLQIGILGQLFHSARSCLCMESLWKFSLCHCKERHVRFRRNACFWANALWSWCEMSPILIWPTEVFRDVLLMILQRRFCDIVNCDYDYHYCLEILFNQSININQWSSILFPNRYSEQFHLPLVEQTGSAQIFQHILIHSNYSSDSLHEKYFVQFFLYIITPVVGNSECHFGHWMNHLFNYFIPKHWFVHEFKHHSYTL